MEKQSTNGGTTSFSLRWPTELVEAIDSYAQQDKRTRNNWLEVYVGRKLSQDEAAGTLRPE